MGRDESREIEILRRVPLFAGMPAPALAALAARLRRRRVPAGTPVVYKGDPAGALYLIAAGRVKVHEATTRGHEVILEVLGPGGFFGGMSLLDDQPRSAAFPRWSQASCCCRKGMRCARRWPDSPPSPRPCCGPSRCACATRAVGPRC